LDRLKESIKIGARDPLTEGTAAGEGAGETTDLRILTIVKQVPDSNATIKVLPDGTGIDQAGLKLVPDPFDEFGVELAVQLREKRGDVKEIVAMTLGPDKAAEALRIALAMGADTAVHLCDAKFETKDEVYSAALLASAIKKDKSGFDLVLCGKHNIDLDSGAVGPAVAEYLGWPHVGAVTGLEISSDGKRFSARRRIEGAEEVVEGDLPVLLTIEKGLVEARYPSLPNLMKAKKKPVANLTAADLPPDMVGKPGTRFDSLSPPAARPACKFIDGEPEQMAKELARLLREEAKVL
jgi:electron transfer flavoprotein beta subunit